MYNVFNSYHPLSGFLYFCAAITFPVFSMHPAILALSVLAAAAYALFLIGWHKLWKRLLFGAVLVVFLALINMLFNHRGVTVLCYLGDNPLTMESILYGLISALMIFGVILWFICFNEIIRADKFIFLFGKVSASAALIVSMTLRFVPLMKRRFDEIDAAQRCFIKAGKSWRSRLGLAARELSALVEQSLEGVVVTADSMKARGYGKRRRSCFLIFRFTASDGGFCVFLLLCSAAILGLLAGGSMDAAYFPRFSAEWGMESLLACVLYLILSFSPMIIEAVEWLRWNCFR